MLARERELLALAEGMAGAGRGVLQFITETDDPSVIGEFEMMRRVLAKTGVPGIYSLLQGGNADSESKDLWRDLLKFGRDAQADGVSLRPVVAPRAIGLLMGLEGSQHPFKATPTYLAMKDLPLAERVARRRGQASIASHKASTPSPVLALTRSTGTAGPSATPSVARTWASTCSARGRSALWMAITSATSSTPAFSH
jgi:hypothetical protein